MKKTLITIATILLTLYGLIWSGAFVIYTSIASHIINDAGEKPALTGFPLTPALEFSGDYTTKSGIKLSITSLKIKGFPFPSQTLELQSDQPIKYIPNGWTKFVPIDSIHLTAQIPTTIPKNNSKEDWAFWRDHDGAISIPTLYIRSHEFTLTGTDGTLNLNDRLHWNGSMNAKLKGADQFVLNLAEQGTIPQKAALLTQNFLAFLTHPDEVTKEPVIITAFQVRDSNIFLGPIKILELPNLSLQ